METRICRKCGDEKIISEFYKRCIYGVDNHCKECISEYNKKRYIINGKEVRKQRNKYYYNNIEKASKQTKKYKNDHKEYYKEYQRKYQRKLRNNPIFRLSRNMSRAIWESLKGNKNGRRWEKLIGYTQEDLRKHLESQFKQGMTWENYKRNGWHIDHKIPISLFNIKGMKSKGFKKCWALENLQPLWEKENISKSNKIFYL